MSISVELLIAIGGVIINLVAVFIAATSIMRSNTATEVRHAERMTTLERDLKHLTGDLGKATANFEQDIQNLYNFHRDLKDTIIKGRT